jgi:hypothetical protein
VLPSWAKSPFPGRVDTIHNTWIVQYGRMREHSENLFHGSFLPRWPPKLRRQSLKKQEKCFPGGKGAVASQFWSTINFNRLEKGVGFFSPPEYLVTQNLSPIHDICGVFRRFPAFSGVFRRFAANWRQPRARHRRRRYHRHCAAAAKTTVGCTPKPLRE